MGTRRWVRIGIGISSLWIAASAIALASADLRVARLLRYAAFELCDYANHHLCRCGNCWQDVMALAAFADHPLANFGLVALAPMVLLSTCVLAAVAVSRAIARLSG